ncbi:MAG TPA: SGNH/GDSL hydrolase family protein [Microbacteriaceae bacterium]
MTSHALLQRSALILGGGVLAAALAFGSGSAAFAAASPNAASAATAVKTATASGPAGLNYVALGDSYSAGYGLGSYSSTSPADGCFQSSQNFPHQVAQALGLKLTDATCSGATMANVTDTAQNTGLGIAPVQLGALSASTNIVTVTISGNDLGFADIALNCAALGANGPLANGVGNDCESTYAPGGVDSLKPKIDNTITPDLNKTFADIRSHAPNAKIFVIGYPALAPNVANTPAGGCFTSALASPPNILTPPFPENAYPYTTHDVPYLNQTEGELNAAIQAQAEAVPGVQFLPLFSQTQANTPCAGNPNSDLFGITLQPLTSPPTGIPIPRLGSIQLALGALHPNQRGVDVLTTTVKAAINAAFPVDSGGSGTQPVTTVTGPVNAASTAPLLADSGSDAATALAAGALALFLGMGTLILVAIRRRSAKRR